MQIISQVHRRAIQQSEGDKAVLFLLVAPEDCNDTKTFLKAVDASEEALKNKLVIIRSEGWHKKGDQEERKKANSEGMMADLAYFQYADGRGHFPSGALYMNGKEVCRLPSDSECAAMTSDSFTQWVMNAIEAGRDAGQESRLGGKPYQERQ